MIQCKICNWKWQWPGPPQTANPRDSDICRFCFWRLRALGHEV
jgi:hypothetical protein